MKRSNRVSMAENAAGFGDMLACGLLRKVMLLVVPGTSMKKKNTMTKKGASYH